MAIACNLGFPRIGAQRELKRAVEGFWSGTLDPDELQATAKQLRRRHWELQRDAVETTLVELQADQKPVITVFNKADCVRDTAELRRWVAETPNSG